VGVGWFSQHGRGATQMENMSAAISSCSIIYLAGAILLVAASVRAGKDIIVRRI